MDTQSYTGQMQNAACTQTSDKNTSLRTATEKIPGFTPTSPTIPLTCNNGNSAKQNNQKQSTYHPPWPKTLLTSLAVHILLLLGIFSFGEVTPILEASGSQPVVIVSLGNGPAGSNVKPSFQTSKQSDSGNTDFTERLLHLESGLPSPRQEKPVQEPVVVQQPAPNTINLEKDKIKPPPEPRGKKHTTSQPVGKKRGKNTALETNTALTEAPEKSNGLFASAETQQGSGTGTEERQGNTNTGGGHADAKGYAKTHYEYIKKQIRKHLVYSNQAKRMGLQGTVTVAFTIAQDGSAHNLSVSRSSGYESLDESALTAVKNASPFTPPPKPARITIPIDFNLK